MERQEFSALYEHLRGPLFSYAAARLSPHAALDVVQDTFEIVWAKRHEAPSDFGKQSAWCFGIARNKILQEHQRVHRKHHDNRFLEDVGNPDSAEDDVSDAVVEAMTGKVVWRSLSGEDRRFLLLVASTDLSGAEMAATLDISHVAFRRRVSRLRERIAAGRRVAEDVTSREEVAGHE